MDDAAQKFKAGFNGAADDKETDDMATDAAAETPAVVIAVGSPEGEDATGEAPAAAENADAEAAPGEPDAATPEASDGDAPMTPEEQHKEATWAGRLRKREEELKAREQALMSRAEEPMGDEEGAEDTTLADEELGELDEGGEFDPDDPEQALARLEEDFGEDFTRMLKSAFRGILGEALAELDPKLAARFDSIEAGLNGVVSDMTINHFESLEDAHPDCQEIAEDPAFGEWIAGLPEEERAEAETVIQNGRTRAVIKLLDKYKAAKQEQETTAQAEQPMNDAIDEAAAKAAAGVRSNAVSPQMGADQSADPMEAFRRGFRNAGN